MTTGCILKMAVYLEVNAHVTIYTILLIQEFAIMSEPLDPLSLEMGSERTCWGIHFQEVQGGSLRLIFWAISLQILFIWSKFIQIDLNCTCAKKNMKDNSKNPIPPNLQTDDRKLVNKELIVTLFAYILGKLWTPVRSIINHVCKNQGTQTWVIVERTRDQNLPTIEDDKQQ